MSTASSKTAPSPHQSHRPRIVLVTNSEAIEIHAFGHGIAFGVVAFPAFVFVVAVVELHAPAVEYLQIERLRTCVLYDKFIVGAVVIGAEDVRDEQAGNQNHKWSMYHR